jgi:hypothetical protein
MEQGAAELRQMRILLAVFLLTVLLLAYAAEEMAGTTAGYSETYLGVMICLAILNGMQAYYFRRNRLFPALDKLRQDPNDSSALKQWRGSITINLCLTEAIALYGFMLRFIGASRRVSWPFLGAALILMLVWRPQLDLRGEASKTGIAQ